MSANQGRVLKELINANLHTHDNKDVLDSITAKMVTSWNQVVTDWNKVFYFDTDGNLRVKLNLIGEHEVSAYGIGESSESGLITIVDNLTSTRTDAALSANQGRILKEMLENVTVDLSDYYTSAQVDNLLAGKSDTGHTHTFASLTSKPTTLSGYGITNVYTESEVDDLLDDIINGNVYSATRLKTTRYIWGQPFNGTADVDGDLTECTSIRISDTERTFADTADLSSSPMLRITNTGENYGLYAWITGSGNGHIQCGREDDNNTMYNLILQERDGNVGIGTKTPSYKLTVNGSGYFSGSVTESSDERLKSDIRPLAYNGMLAPITFLKDGRREVGFSAQAVRELYPDLVMEDDTQEHYLSLNYSRITAVLQAEILWLKQEIETLNEQLDTMKGGTD